MIYLARRLLQGIPVFFGVTALVFCLLRLAPGDRAHILLRERGIDLSAEALGALRVELGLDKPLHIQYGMWLLALLRGDLGFSTVTGEPVSAGLFRHFRMTAILALPSLALVVLIAFPLGMLSAVFQGRLPDALSRITGIIALSIPSFCAGLLLILLFSVRLHWLPSFGSAGPANFIMPCAVLVISTAAHYTRLVRAALLEELSREYIRSGRARGIGKWNLVWSHGMRNAAIPIITSLGMSLALMLGGQAVIEAVFSWPGMGKWLIDGIGRRDYPVVEGCVLLYALLFTLINLAADCVCLLLDPQTRLAEGWGRKRRARLEV